MTDELKKPAQLRKFSKSSHKKKIKTLRQNVLHPLLITISVISVIMLLFFNVVILLMLYSDMRSDMRSISAFTEQIAQVEGDTLEEPQAIFNLFKREIERRSISYRINMVLLDQNGNTVLTASDFYSSEESSVKEEIMSLPACQNGEDEISGIRCEKDVLLVLKVPVPSKTGRTLAVYTSVRSLLSTVKSGNQALLIIIALSVIGFIIASHIISNQISKPIKALSDHMDVLGDGDFSPVHIKETSAELNKLTVSINEMLARLEAYNKAHTTSIQNLSHDLRTPLMSIGGYAEGIKYGVIEDTSEAADVILKESKRLTDVVEKMLILSKLDTLNQPVNMTPVYLADFLEEETKSLDGYAMQNHVRVHFKIERRNVKVLADSSLLSTIVRNLLSNAIRHAASEITVLVYDTDTQTCFALADDGKGLTEEDKKYLFTRYYVGETGHSGLGLSTSKSAAEYMGCTIQGENRADLKKDDIASYTCGAVFTVGFPKYE